VLPRRGRPRCYRHRARPRPWHGELHQLRRAYGLLPKQSFTQITGESTEALPVDPALTPADEINDPDSLDFLALFDIDGIRSRSIATRRRPPRYAASGGPHSQPGSRPSAGRWTRSTRLSA
jgi:hypothetical protein